MTPKHPRVAVTVEEVERQSNGPPELRRACTRRSERSEAASGSARNHNVEVVHVGWHDGNLAREQGIEETL